MVGRPRQRRLGSRNLQSYGGHSPRVLTLHYLGERARHSASFSRRRVVEAGGVEPPSEKPCNTKTTCLAHSEGFAGGTQKGQDAPPASPMISPPQSGPKSGDQPTV
jgi:hypothetical protein